MNDYYTQELGGEPLIGFEHEYKIWNDGRILSLLTDQWVEQRVDSSGYLKVDLSKDGHKYTRRVHILVATQFVPNPNNLPVVDHIDGNKQNPHYTNLEWVTQQENTIRAYKTGLHTKTNNKVVVRSDGERFGSLTEAAKASNTTKSAISKCLAGKQKQAGGYTWENSTQK